MEPVGPLPREREAQARSFVRMTFGPNRAAMGLDQASANEEAQSIAGDAALSLPRNAVERLKDVRKVF